VTSKLKRLSDFELARKKTRNFSDSFGKLLFSSAASDITVTVGNETIFAHKMMLCVRSEVFKAMFDSVLIESKTNTLNIVDFCASTVKNLLRYLYTDGFDPDLSMLRALDLIAIADKYQVSNLKEDCLQFMSRKLVERDDEGLDSATEIAVVANEHGLDNIVIQALDRIIDLFPLSAVLDTEEKADEESDEEEENDECEQKIKKQRLNEVTDDDVISYSPTPEHSSLFTTLGSTLYFRMVERAVRECQKKREDEIEEEA
jgi:hypothetical protein